MALHIELIGGVAATLTTVCWVPQALKVIRTRHTADLSLITQVVFAAGILLWLAYGVLIGSWPVMGANAISFVLISVIIAFKLRYG